MGLAIIQFNDNYYFRFETLENPVDKMFKVYSRKKRRQMEKQTKHVWSLQVTKCFTWYSLLLPCLYFFTVIMSGGICLNIFLCNTQGKKVHKIFICFLFYWFPLQCLSSHHKYTINNIFITYQFTTSIILTKKIIKVVNIFRFILVLFYSLFIITSLSTIQGTQK